MPTNSNTTLTKRPLFTKTTKKNFLSQIKEHSELIAALLSGLIILIAWVSTAIMPHSIWITLHIIAFLIGGYAQGKEGIMSTIENKELNVELLMVIAAIGSAAIGYWTEGAILIFIFALAGALETYTMQKSKQEISALMTLQPEEACVLINENEKIIPVSQLQVEDIILVRASERIPADGKIIKGNTAIDESAITGESIPVMKNVTNDVFAGTVALDGSITVKVTKPANETVFQQIIKMIQSAEDEKAPTQLFIERLEGRYVKIVLLSVFIMMFLPYLLFGWTLTKSIYRAMILLVVASPCALVASIMPATLSAISNSARKGVLFKGGVHAEMVSQVNAMAFDKTGTLTNGAPVVTDVCIDADYDMTRIHTIVGAIESQSTHPLAKALVDYTLTVLHLEHFNVKVDEMKTVSGRGVIGVVDGETWHIGRENLTAAKSHPFEQQANQFSDQGKTIVYVIHQHKIIAIYALQDTVRSDAKQAIAALRKQNIYTIMLTGDNERTAKAVAEEVGIEDYIAECLPNEKVDHLKRVSQKYGKTAMIGDGINDAPALATADIGIAMGEGTDVALETADMVLMKNDLTKITGAIQLSKKMNRIIKQNIIFSLGVISVLILSNFFQVIDLPLGVIGHEGSTILVILNGLRLVK